jgi:Na+/melibiose symporter-like transporter
MLSPAKFLSQNLFNTFVIFSSNNLAASLGSRLAFCIILTIVEVTSSGLGGGHLSEYRIASVLVYINGSCALYHCSLSLNEKEVSRTSSKFSIVVSISGILVITFHPFSKRFVLGIHSLSIKPTILL